MWEGEQQVRSGSRARSGLGTEWETHICLSVAGVGEGRGEGPGRGRGRAADLPRWESAAAEALVKQSFSRARAFLLPRCSWFSRDSFSPRRRHTVARKVLSGLGAAMALPGHRPPLRTPSRRAAVVCLPWHLARPGLGLLS